MRRLRVSKKVIALLISGCCSLSAFSAPTILHIQTVSNDNDKYAFEMLQLALSYTNGKYKTEVDPANEKTLARTMNDVESGATDVMWTATDKEKESAILPIRIPLYKGLFGYRILIINRNNLEKFN